MTYEAIIIGGGPGGLMAALYLKRLGRTVLVIDRFESRVAPVPKIRNLVGYRAGISGITLLRRLRAQVKKYGVTVRKGEARIFEKQRGGFRVKIGGRTYQSKTVILATGMKDIQPPVTNWKELCRKNVVAYCPICDAYDHRRDSIGILVSDSKSLGKIKYLNRICHRLHVITQEKFRWPKDARKYFAKNAIEAVHGKFEALRLAKGKKGVVIEFADRAPMKLRLLYVELGVVVPDQAFRTLKGLARTTAGFIRVNSHQQTSIPRVYAIGDCADSVSQISVAIGQAAIAACHLHNDLLAEN